MAKNDQQEAYEKILSASLARVIEFNKFAETKNAALLAICSAWVVGILNISFGNFQIPTIFRTSFYIMLPLFLVSISISIWSFVPRLRLAEFVGTDNRPENLLFFGDAARMNNKIYIESIRSAYFQIENNSMTEAYCRDMAQQIHVNSKIAFSKFKKFNFAALISSAAFSVMFVSSAIFLISHININ